MLQTVVLELDPNEILILFLGRTCSSKEWKTRVRAKTTLFTDSSGKVSASAYLLLFYSLSIED